MNLRARLFFRIFFVFGLLLNVGCESGERKTQSRGFHLPKGDIEVGKSLFVKFDCNYCHVVAGVGIPKAAGLEGTPAIVLGGEVSRVRSYGDPVTSIINPEHVVAPQYRATLSKEEKTAGEFISPMPGYNEEMSVAQLVDLAAFLHSRYELIEPELDNFYYTTP